MEASPVNNQSDSPHLRQEIGGGISARQKEYWVRARLGRDWLARCEEDRHTVLEHW